MNTILDFLTLDSIWWELFGYLGTVLVVASMLMTSLTKLRIVNICGSVISTIYAALSHTWPIVVMNVSLILINSFHLIKNHLNKKKENN